MPKFEKLSQQEIDKLKKRRATAIDLTEYLSYLNTLKSGDWGSLTLEANETSRAIKRRLTIAAKQQNKTLKYTKAEGSKIVFEVK